MNEYVYAAELAGLGYSLANTKAGITLAIKVKENVIKYVIVACINLRY